MSMVRCVVIGAAGRMGDCIINAIHHTEGVKLAGATEIKGHKRVGTDAGEFSSIGKTGISIVDNLDPLSSECDVLIDFTAPESSMNSLEWAASNKKSAVIGTTGFSPRQTERINTLTQDIPCVIAPNMSVGINLMLNLISQVATTLKDDYDVEIIESHHRLKKDAPSGTAVKIAEVLAESLKRNLDQVAVHQRKGLIGERSREEIGIQVIRAGDIVGEHTVLFAGAGERLEITHRAHNRDTFARGAVRAAQWVAAQNPGLYTMQDVLGLSQ
jgi:4-hydroxy-tetrahydrodipicolinate reductase